MSKWGGPSEPEVWQVSRFAQLQQSASESSQRSVMVDARRWKTTLRITLYCLLVWFVCTTVPLIIAKPIASWKLFGWPAPFAIVAFCVPLAYLAIIGIYCLLMDRLERNLQGSDE